MDVTPVSPPTRRRLVRSATALLGLIGLARLATNPAEAQYYPPQPPGWGPPGSPPPPGFWDGMRLARENLRAAREALLRIPPDPWGRRDRALRNIGQAEEDLRFDRR